MKPCPSDFPHIRGDAQMLPYFKQLDRLPIQDRGRLPNIGGVYFLCAEPDIIVYIGKSFSIRQRWASGHSFFRRVLYGTPKVYIAWMPCDLWMLDLLEQALIRKLRPVGNNKHCSRTFGSVYAEIRDRRQVAGWVNS